MTPTSVAAASPPTAANALDPTNSGSRTDPTDAAFGAALAGARSTDTTGSDDSAPPDGAGSDSPNHSAGHDPTANDSTATTAAGGQGSPTAKPPATQTSVAGLTGLVVPTWTPPPPGPTPPAALDAAPTSADAPDSTRLAELAGPPTVPVLNDEANLAAGSAAAGTAETTPATTATKTTVPLVDPVSAALSAATSGTVSGSAQFDHTSTAAPGVGNTAGTLTSGLSPNATAFASNAPAAVDTAGPAPSDRPRPQVPFSAPTTAATTFAPTPPAPVAASANASDGTAANATVALAPAEQLVSVLTPLRATTNGTYTLRLELKPPELGRVEMRVEMKDGVLSASIHADHEGSAQLVRDALADLRDLLNKGGVQTGDLTVSDGGVGPDSRDGSDAASSAGTASSGPSTPSDDATTVGTIPADADSDSTSFLDVRL
jgi:hypothetical protein